MVFKKSVVYAMAASGRMQYDYKQTNFRYSVILEHLYFIRTLLYINESGVNNKHWHPELPGTFLQSSFRTKFFCTCLTMR